VRRVNRAAGAASDAKMEGWQGWDDYAPFYDWENARTVGRSDVGFWRDLARRIGGHVLELGCGTGRLSLPVGRTGVRFVGIDRSAPMLARARRRIRRARLPGNVSLVRGDIRALPFQPSVRFDLVMAAYGVLQSLVREADLSATLASVAEVMAPGGVFGVDLVPDLPVWAEYRKRISLRGRRRAGGARVTLIESVRQDRRRRLTIFDQEYIERRGARHARRRFSLVFRTLSVRQMTSRLERAGFDVTAVLGDYGGEPWDPRADVWLILAKKR
jgi:ubiquinone/menaquinone biosynthesis C-methylase UbiE